MIPSDDSRLAAYKIQYEKLTNQHKNGSTWEKVAARLLANPEKLEIALKMQGGGQLFYVTPDGTLEFKDKGMEPVLYGFDSVKELFSICNRNSALMNKVVKWANSREIEVQVRKEGYELFEEDGNYRLSERMKRAAAVNESNLFIASENKREWRYSLLKGMRSVYFRPVHEDIFVDGGNPANRNVFRGVVRLLII